MDKERAKDILSGIALEINSIEGGYAQTEYTSDSEGSFIKLVALIRYEE